MKTIASSKRLTDDTLRGATKADLYLNLKILRRERAMLRFAFLSLTISLSSIITRLKMLIFNKHNNNEKKIEWMSAI